MDLLSALVGVTPGLNDDPGQQAPDIEVPELDPEQDPIGGFDPEPEQEIYEGSWDGGVQMRAFVSAYRIGAEVREDLGLPDTGVVAIYSMRTQPDNVSSSFVVVEDAGWEGWQFLATPEQGPAQVTAVITTELYVDGMFDLFDPAGAWHRDAMAHALLVDIDLVSEDIRSGYDPDTPYVLAVPAMEASHVDEFEMFGGWGLMPARAVGSPWGDFSNYATSRPDAESSVGSIAHLGHRLADGQVEMGEGWELRVSWDQNAPWAQD